mmetsp:Transcript_30288/g.57102  ORF Transcript_30288/g.57102 Transcript_30288/m.57102 type:complete len:403 (+) Transcript_30288:225-1433(+)
MGCGASTGVLSVESNCTHQGSNADTETGGKGKPTLDPQSKAAEMRERARTVRVRDLYKLGKTLGTGGFAVVKLGTHKETKVNYAMKIMALPQGNTKDEMTQREDIFKEINILLSVKHPNVIYLHEYFEEVTKVYLVTELLTGGELLDALLERGTYSEADARLCFKQLLEGIAYLHKLNIVHRDLKLENLLLSTKGDFTTIKIADFGLAKKSAESNMETICGTPQYVAPEVLESANKAHHGQNAYTANVDMWSAGVVLFVLLGGYPPFYDESEPALFEKIKRGHFAFDDECWDDISAGAKDLISKLLVVNPQTRLTSEEALNHPWMNSSSVSTAHMKHAQPNMKENFKRRFKGSVAAIIATKRMNNVLGAAMKHNADAIAEEAELTCDATQMAAASTDSPAQA